MSAIPQDLFQWLSAVSVPVAGFAIKYAVALNREFIVLSTLFHAREDAFKKLESEQKATSITVALQGQTLEKVQTELTGINQKLEALPRIATQLENLVPQLASVVPRAEIEHRFQGIEQSLNDLKNLRHFSK